MGSRQSRLDPTESLPDRNTDVRDIDATRVELSDELRSRLKNIQSNPSRAHQEALVTAYNDGLTKTKDSISRDLMMKKYEQNARWLAKVEYAKEQEEINASLLAEKLLRDGYRIQHKPSSCFSESEEVMTCFRLPNRTLVGCGDIVDAYDRCRAANKA